MSVGPQELDSLWKKLQKELHENVSPQSFEIWIRPMRLLSANARTVVVEVPNPHHRSWINENYTPILESALRKVLGGSPRLKIQVAESAPGDGNLSTGTAQLSQSPGIGSGRPNPAKTFDNFVVGSCNEFAHAAALAVADFPGSQHNPLFIYGSTGLGKTHLLHAVGNRILAANPDAQVVYVTAENFMNEMINAIRHKRMVEFRDRYRSQATVLLMDDIQFLGGKDRTQEEFFHTFETLQNSGRQIVITADMLPRNIKMLEDRLRTRFEGGLMADLQPPDMETMLAILRSKAEELDLVVPDDAAEYIASGLSGNIRELEGVLKHLAAVTAFYREPVTLETVRLRLRSLLKTEREVLGPDQVIQVVARFTNVKPSEIRGATRARRVTRPRQLVILLLRKHTGLSFPEIGRALGGRDHSTIQYGYRRARELAETDPDFRALVELVERNLGL